MKTILIDVDDVICENHFVPVINSYLNKNYKEDDFETAFLEDDVFKTKEELNKFYDFYLSVDSYKDCNLKDGVYEVLQRLIKNNRVIILTNACHRERQLEFGRQYTDKWKFLLEKLPFFPADNIVFAAAKDIFVADVIIDDRVGNLKGNYKYKLLFSCFHNKNITDKELKEKNIVRVNNWHEIEDFINSIND